MAQGKPDPAKKVSNPRIAKLIELEASGRIKPEHQQELDSYRNQGLAPKRVTGDAGAEQGKAGSFYARMTGSNTDYMKTGGGEGAGPRSIVRKAVNKMAPDLENTFLNDSDRQLADQAVRDFIGASLRYESGAAIPDSEFDKQYRIFFPEPGDKEAVIAQKAAARERAIQGMRVSAGPAADQIDRQVANGEKVGISKPTGGPADAVQDAIAGPSETGEEQFSTDKDKAYASALRDAFNGGASKAELDAVAVSHGYPALPAKEWTTAIRNRDSGRKVDIAVPRSGYKAPSIVGRLAASSLGAGTIAATNAATMGNLDEIVGLTGGDAARAQQAKEVARAAHPYADVAGNVVGGVAATLGADAALTGLAGRFGLGVLNAAGRTGTIAPRIMAEDATYGAGYGAGESNDDRLSGAAIGGLAGAAGGLAGRFGVNTLGRAAAPTGGELGELYANGVRPSLGQRFVNSGTLGRIVNRAEESMQSLPIVGDAVRGTRQRARDQWERGAFNQALEEIGHRLPDDIELGTEPHAYMQETFNQAYDHARSQMHFAPDQQFHADQQAFAQDLLSGVLSDDQANQVERILRNTVESRLRGGQLTGDTYKTASSDIGRAARRLSGTDPLVSEALTNYQAILDAGARRSSPPAAAEAMDAADRGYAMAVRIENAAAARGGDTGRMTPTQFDRAVQRDSGGVRSRQYLRGDALLGDYAEQGKSLVDRLPNSGTADRVGMMGLFGAGGAAATGGSLTGTLPAAFGLSAAATIPYMPGIRNIATGLLAPRNQAPRAGRNLTTLGRVLRERAQVGGAVTAPVLIENSVVE